MRLSCGLLQVAPDGGQVFLVQGPAARFPVISEFRSCLLWKSYTRPTSYWFLKTVEGSIRVARRAGMPHATRARTASRADTPRKVGRSVGCTPKSKLLSARTTAKETAKPIAIPAITSLTAWPRISLRISAFCARARCACQSPICAAVHSRKAHHRFQWRRETGQWR